MEGKLRLTGEKTSLIDGKPGYEVVKFTMDQLVAAFEIPDVLDVSRVDPVRQRHNLDALSAIESFVNGAVPA